MEKLLKTINLLSVLLTIAANYLLNSSLYNGKTIGELSDKYDNLFTPASYAFAIWGIIYIGLLVFAVFQYKKLGESNMTGSSLLAIGPWFALANLGNILWLLAWLNEWVGVSVLLMLFILFSLGKAFVNSKIGIWEAPKVTIACFWWPIMLYFGWITVATVSNFSAFGASLGWQGEPLSPQFWTIAVMCIATGIYTFVVWKTNARLYAMVGVWAFIAIAYRQLEPFPAIGWTAIVLCGFILANVSLNAYKAYKQGNHSFVNS